MIQIDSVCKTFNTPNGELRALDEITLTIPHRQLITLLGPSGCGKTTLLKIIGGLEHPTSGRVIFEDVTVQPPQIAMVFQQPTLLPWRSAVQNVALLLELGPNDKSGEEILYEARTAIALVGLGPFEDFYPHQLSGGMCSRVALARALATRPTILLLDEPFATLDEITRAELQDMLYDLRLRLALTTILVTHSTEEAMLMSDRVVVLTSRPGKLVADHIIDLPASSFDRRGNDNGVKIRGELVRILNDSNSMKVAYNGQ